MLWSHWDWRMQDWFWNFCSVGEMLRWHYETTQVIKKLKFFLQRKTRQLVDSLGLLSSSSPLAEKGCSANLAATIIEDKVGIGDACMDYQLPEESHHTYFECWPEYDHQLGVPGKRSSETEKALNRRAWEKSPGLRLYLSNNQVWSLRTKQSRQVYPYVPRSQK